jgi:hypothetical protein
VRFRIVAPIGGVGTLEQVKIIPSSAKHNTDGFDEYFGRSEFQISLLIHQKLSDDTANSPVDGTIAFSAGISLTMVDNRFASGVTDEIGLVLQIPPNLDTSRLITFRYGFRPITAAIANVMFQSRYRIIKAGDILDGTLISSNVFSITALDNVANKLFINEHAIDLRGSVPGDLLACTLFRIGNTPPDTYANSVDIAFWEGFGFGWN